MKFEAFHATRFMMQPLPAPTGGVSLLLQLRAAISAELGVGQVLGLAVGAGLGGLGRAALRAELGVGGYLGVAVPAGERGGRRRGGRAQLGRGGLGSGALGVAADALGDDL